MIAVDKSVWINLFRDAARNEVGIPADLVHRDRITVGELVPCELLQGLRTAREVVLVEDALAAFHVVGSVGSRVARRVAANYRSLRARGVRVDKTIDHLIAALCVEHDVPLLHRDRDLDSFEVHLALRVVHAA